MTTKEGINVFLRGYVKTENMKFRDVALTFKVHDNIDAVQQEDAMGTRYPELTKKLGDFTLHVEPGSFHTSEIIVLLGENGTGKTTFVRLLAGKDKELKKQLPEISISLKPQKIAPKFQGTVRDLFHKKLAQRFHNSHFQSLVVKPMNIDAIIDNQVQELSGGELQKIALILALGKPAQVYLLDEPSAYLDAEQRIITAKCIKRYIMAVEKTAFIVEHDFIMATYMADRVIVYTGTPGKECTAHSPKKLVEGMNQFLKILNVTFRRDPENWRPRINKYGSNMHEK